MKENNTIENQELILTTEDGIKVYYISKKEEALLEYISKHTQDERVIERLETIRKYKGKEEYLKYLEKAAELLKNNLKNREYSFEEKIEFIKKEDKEYYNHLIGFRETIKTEKSYINEVEKIFNYLIHTKKHEWEI